MFWASQNYAKTAPLNIHLTYECKKNCTKDIYIDSSTSWSAVEQAVVH